VTAGTGVVVQLPQCAGQSSAIVLPRSVVEHASCWTVIHCPQVGGSRASLQSGGTVVVVVSVVADVAVVVVDSVVAVPVVAVGVVTEVTVAEVVVAEVVVAEVAVAEVDVAVVVESVGAAVGTAVVGAWVGGAVGGAVGARVGVRDGWADGPTVDGVAVGAGVLGAGVVGAAVGPAVDGAAVGCSVGGGVGRAVSGAAVGAGETHCSTKSGQQSPNVMHPGSQKQLWPTPYSSAVLEPQIPAHDGATNEGAEVGAGDWGQLSQRTGQTVDTDAVLHCAWANWPQTGGSTAPWQLGVGGHPCE
jgi:hypothetical protein